MSQIFKNEETLTTFGFGLIVACIVILLLLILVVGRSEKKEEKKVDVKAMTISALLIAAAMVLSQIKLFSMPQGGSVTLLSMLPIALCAYMFGTRQGVIAGLALGLVNLVFGPYVIHPVQLFLDYPIAFGAMGIGGIFRKMKHGLIFGYLLGVVGRYVCAVASGVIFFGAYAPEGFNALTWSLWYNLTYLAAEAVITVIVLIPTEKQFARMRDQL